MRGSRVLVVDDDPAFRAAVRAVLESEGCVVDEVGDARQALRQALARPPALVLLDVGLPSLDGWELCEILRRQSQTCDVPVLFITGRVEVRDRITAMQVGGSDFLTKPFASGALRAKVRELLEAPVRAGADGNR